MSISPFIFWMLELFCIGSVTKQDYAPSSSFLLPFFQPTNGSFELTSILLESFRHVVDGTRIHQEKKIEFTDITSGKRGEGSKRKRMAHNRIDGTLFLVLLHLPWS